jgi:hypothetical protein
MIGGDQYFVQPFMADAYQVPTPGQPVISKLVSGRLSLAPCL